MLLYIVYIVMSLYSIYRRCCIIILAQDAKPRKQSDAYQQTEWQVWCGLLLRGGCKRWEVIRKNHACSWHQALKRDGFAIFTRKKCQPSQGANRLTQRRRKKEDWSSKSCVRTVAVFQNRYFGWVMGKTKGFPRKAEANHTLKAASMHYRRIVVLDF